MSNPKRFLFVDGDSILRRAWEGAEDGKQSGVFRAVAHRIVKSMAPWDRTVVGFDGGPGGGVDGFRRARVPTYKSNRTDPGGAFREQRERTIAALRSEACTVIVGPRTEVDGAEGFAEADDIAAWMQKEFLGIAEDDSLLRIVSDDGDVEALVTDPRIEVLKPRLMADRGSPVYNAKRIEDERGVEPQYIPQLKALKGDKGDGFPGFPGIGDTTAALLVRYYAGNLAHVIERAPEDESLPPKGLNKAQRASLAAGGIDLALQNLWLATLRPDLPLDFDELVLNPVPPEPRARDYFKKEEPAGTDSEPRPDSKSEPSNKIEVRRTSVLAREEINPFALQPGSLGDLYDLSLAMHRSGIYSNMPTPEAIMAVILEANERRVPAGTALRNAYFVPASGNRPAKVGWSAAYIAGLVVTSPMCEYFELIPDKCDEAQAVVRFKRKGRPAGEFPYTLEDARRSGLLGKDAWAKFTKNMLRAAAIREAARAFFFDVVAGVLMPDELREESLLSDDVAAANV